MLLHHILWCSLPAHPRWYVGKSSQYWSSQGASGSPASAVPLWECRWGWATMWVCFWCVCPEILKVAILSTNNPLMESHQGFLLSYWHCCHDTIGLHLPIFALWSLSLITVLSPVNVMKLFLSYLAAGSSDYKLYAAGNSDSIIACKYFPFQGRLKHFLEQVKRHRWEVFHYH